MNFGQAIEVLRENKKVARKGWNGKGMHLVLIGAAPTYFNDGGFAGDMQAFIALKTVQGTYVPWQPSQTDMLAEDWEVVE
jgi:hypothetical protein